MANKRRYRVSNLEVICGSAPECLTDLPRPDGTLSGGGGNRLGQILESVLSHVCDPTAVWW